MKLFTSTPTSKSTTRQPDRRTGANTGWSTVDGRLEEIRPLAGGNFLVKKDFILRDSEGGHRVDIPSPSAGYVYFNRAYGTAAIYDAPRPGGQLVANVLHMDPATFRLRDGEHVEYGQGLGVQDGTGRNGTRTYGIHAHVEASPEQFRQYIADIESGVIRPGQYPARDAAADRVVPPAPTGAEPAVRTFPPGGAIGQMIASGEGNYNSFNRGRAGDAHGAEIDFSQMTVNEVMRRQALPAGDPDRLFAVGKYQIIPGTMAGAVARLGIDGDEKLTPELQERLFSDYLITHKRPGIRAYVTGESDDRTGALHETALEWASVGDPERGGLSHYGGTGNNHASITPAQMGEALDQARSDYRELVAGGMAEDAAWRAITGQGADAQRMSPNHSNVGGAMRADSALRLGSSGDAVQSLQTSLRQLGADIEPDGRFGPKTERAVKGYQTMIGLEPDGVAGPATLGALQRATQSRTVSDGHGSLDAPSDALLQATSLRVGADGAQVQELQRLLEQRGAKIHVDGQFGPNTERALRGYQLMNGLEPDGVVGPRTMAALQADALELRGARATTSTPELEAQSGLEATSPAPMPTQATDARQELTFGSREQLDQYEQFLASFGPALEQKAFSSNQIKTLAAATVGHLAANARLGAAEQYFLSADGSRIAVRHPNHVFTEMSVDAALQAPAQDHLDAAAQTAGHRAQPAAGEQSYAGQWQEAGQPMVQDVMVRA